MGGRGSSFSGFKTVIITSADGKTKIRLTSHGGKVYRHYDYQGGRYDRIEEMQGLTMNELLRNARKNGAFIKQVSVRQLKAEKKRNLVADQAQTMELSKRNSRRGINRHTAYWSTM